jgi:hypothetical protein
VSLRVRFWTAAIGTILANFKLQIGALSLSSKGTAHACDRRYHEVLRDLARAFIACRRARVLGS